MPAPNGPRLRELRKKAGLTQLELAALAHCAQSHLAQLELGTVGSVGSEVVTSLAMVLQTNVEYLIGTSDDPRPAKQQAIGKLKHDEEALLKAYRLLQRSDFKQQAHAQMHLLVDLERDLERERRQSSRQSRSDGKADHEEDKAAVVS